MTIKQGLELKKEEIIAKYLAGASTPSLAKDYNTNAGNIYYVLKLWSVVRQDRSKVYGKMEDYKEQVLSLYNDGYSCYGIGRKIGVCGTTLIRWLKEWGYDAQRYICQREDKLVDHKEEIIEMYTVQGLSTLEIGKIYSSAPGSVRKLLINNGIDTTPEWPTCDDSFFDKIDTPAKAYYLGIMYTDGCAKRDNHICISMTDLDIIEKMKNLINYSGNIIPSQRSKNGKLCKKIYTLNIRGKNFTEKLTKLGCPPAKTMGLKFPDESIVPKHLHSHLLRGALDGDGSVMKNLYYLAYAGTKDFLQGISDSFLYHVGYEFKMYQPKPDRIDYPIRSAMLCGQEKVKKALAWLYQDSDESIRGDRKYNKYIGVLKDMAEKQKEQTSVAR